MTAFLGLRSRSLPGPFSRVAVGTSLVILLAVSVAGCGPRATRGRPTTKADRRAATTASPGRPTSAKTRRAWTEKKIEPCRWLRPGRPKKDKPSLAAAARQGTS